MVLLARTLPVTRAERRAQGATNAAPAAQSQPQTMTPSMTP
jgi:hypothetical protein